MFLIENDERLCYFKIKMLEKETFCHANLHPSMFLCKFCFTVVQLFIMESPVKFILWFHVILFMTVNYCMCLTIECRKNTLIEKKCEKVTVEN